MVPRRGDSEQAPVPAYGPSPAVGARVPLPHAPRTGRPEPGPDRGRAGRTAPGLLRLDRRDRGRQVAAARRARPAPRRARLRRPDPHRGRRTARHRPVRADPPGAARARRRDPASPARRRRPDPHAPAVARRAAVPRSSTTCRSRSPRCKRIGEMLVDVHGQRESYSLLQPAYQLELLDAFGKLADLRKKYDVAAGAVRDLRRQFKELSEARADPAAGTVAGPLRARGPRRREARSRTNSPRWRRSARRSSTPRASRSSPAPSRPGWPTTTGSVAEVLGQAAQGGARAGRRSTRSLRKWPAARSAAARGPGPRRDVPRPVPSGSRPTPSGWKRSSSGSRS